MPARLTLWGASAAAALFLALAGCGSSTPEKPTRVKATFDGDLTTLFHTAAEVRMQGARVGRVVSMSTIHEPVADEGRVWLRLRPGTVVPPNFEPIIQRPSELRLVRPPKMIPPPRHRLHPIFGGTLAPLPASG